MFSGGLEGCYVGAPTKDCAVVSSMLERKLLTAVEEIQVMSYTLMGLGNVADKLA